LKPHWFHGVAGLLVVLLAVLLAPPAAARNANISGGIQYVTQAEREAAKGDSVEMRRIFGKAVKFLNMGISESPKDVEAWDYLAHAYARLDSAEKCGWAFSQGIALAKADPELKKLLDQMVTNRKHYAAVYAIEASLAYQKAVAGGSVPDPTLSLQAAQAMRMALAVNPEDAKSYCNLAAFYAYAKHFDEALQAVDKGLKLAPQDSCLTSRKDQLGVVLADRAEATGDWAAAIALYEKAAASTPGDLGPAQRLGELYFKQGRALAAKADSLPEGPEKQAALEQAKQAFFHSAEGFGKYSAGHPDEKDGRYNYMIALLQAEKYEDAGHAAIEALAGDPLNPEFHSALSSAYRGLKLEDPANGHTLLARILRDGTKDADPAAAAKKSAGTWGATSDAARLLKEMGPPDDIRTQTIGTYDVECWVWVGPKRGVLMSKGRTVSDVTFAQLVTPAPPKATAPKPASGKKAGGAKAATPPGKPAAAPAPKR
jgi:tetratricopeptide (TPR) repeat protein